MTATCVVPWPSPGSTVQLRVVRPWAGSESPDPASVNRARSPEHDGPSFQIRAWQRPKSREEEVRAQGSGP
eukprot:1050560-Alexandrium_andersonii.AAC.1